MSDQFIIPHLRTGIKLELKNTPHTTQFTSCSNYNHTATLNYNGIM